MTEPNGIGVESMLRQHSAHLPENRILRGDLRQHFREEGVAMELSRAGHLFEQGEVCKQAYLIEKGLVALTHSCANMDRQIYDFMFGASLLMPAVFVSKSTSFSAECLTDVKVYVMSGQALERILEAEPELHFEIYRELGALMERIQSRLGNIMGRHGEARVAFMLSQIDKSMTNSRIATRKDGWICVNQIELASSVGITPVYLNQILKRMKDSGAISLKKGKVKIESKTIIESMFDY